MPKNKKIIKLTTEELQQVKELSGFVDRTLQKYYDHVKDYYFSNFQRIWHGYELCHHPEKYEKYGPQFNHNYIRMHYHTQISIPKFQKKVNTFLLEDKKISPFWAKFAKSGPFSDYIPNLAKNFKIFLQNSKKFEEYRTIRNEYSQQFPSWEKTLWDTFNRALIYPQPLINKETKKVILEWYLVIDSYIRDFEAFFGFFIDPIILQEDPEIDKTYASKIEYFFNNTPEAINNIQNSTIVPLFRNQITHSLYYYDFDNEKIVFPQILKYETKLFEYSLQDCIYLYKNANQFINCCFFHILRYFHIKKLETESANSDFWKKCLDEFLPIYNNTNLNKIEYYQLMDKNSLFQANISTIIDNWNRKTKEELLYMVNLFSEAIEILKFNNGNQELSIKYRVNSASRVIFLCVYNLGMEKCVKPLYQMFHPNKNMHFIKDPKIINYCNSLANQQFTPFFAKFDSEMRNKIAHRNYNFTETHEGFKLMFQLLQYIQEFDKILEPDNYNFMLEVGIGQIWFEIFKGDIGGWEKWISKELEFLQKFSTYPVITACFTVISEIIQKTQNSNTHGFVQLCKNLNKEFNSWDKDNINLFWGLILYWINRKRIEFDSSFTLLLLNQIHNYPDNDHLILVIQAIKTLEAYSFKNNKVVLTNLKKITKRLKEKKL